MFPARSIRRRRTVAVDDATLLALVGSPWLLPALFALVVGDGLCFVIGRHAGLERWRWQRTGAVKRALDRARGAIHSRTAVLVFTARYVPFARIAVNLAAGASGLPVRRFLPLSMAAGLAWAVYNVTIGAVMGATLASAPVLAIALSVVVAITLRLSVDAVVARAVRRREERGGAS